MHVSQRLDMAVPPEMNDTVLAYVLKQMDYREHDAIITVFTKEYGKLSFVSRGVRKMTSKNASAVMPYTQSEILFDYKEHATMFQLKSARCKEYYRYMHEDMMASSAASVIAEIVDVFSLSEDSDQIYNMVGIAFDKLNNGYSSTLVVSLFLVDILRMAGLLPDVDACVVCGKQHVVTMSPKEGGFLCEDHATNIPYMKAEYLRRFRILCKAGIDKIDVVTKYIEENINDLQYLLDILYLHADIKLKTMKFYMHLNALQAMPVHCKYEGIML